MPSQSKTDTARANGAKSHGPVTPEGRAKSSRNSLRHGLKAKAIILPGESAKDFERLRQSYIDQFQPSGGVQMDLVEAMAVARWRLRRLYAIETNLYDHELTRCADDIDEEFVDEDDDHRLAWVFQKIADYQQSLALLIRYEGTLNRSFDRAFKQLLLLQRPVPGPKAGPGLGSFRSERLPAPAPPCFNDLAAPGFNIVGLGKMVAQASACGSLVQQQRLGEHLE